MLEIHPLTGALFGDGPREGEPSVLVVFLYGDHSGHGPADKIHALALNVAKRFGVISASILRPGYWDSCGRRSCGSNNRRFDQYTEPNNRLVLETIENLKYKSGADTVIAVGYSGGAAQLGVVLTMCKNLIDTAILVSCPCDLKAWHQKYNGPDLKNSQSPSDHINNIDPSVGIIAMTGENDTNTPVCLAKDYVDKLTNRGFKAFLTIISGGDHELDTISPSIKKMVECCLISHGAIPNF